MDFEGNGSQVGADDDVVDITELTDTQKETQHDIDKLDAKFATIIKQIGSFEELIRQNDQKIDDLKTEFEKRNPTQIEKLSMQTAKSYPFNVTPEEYWEEKEKTSNYSTENDENGVKQGQYVITKNDVNGDTDWKSISDSLDDDDFMYNQTLNGILKI
jgi:predicted nuclease with TOPRIM domain